MIGIDIVEIERFKTLIEKERFLQKTFTAKERAYFSDKGEFSLASAAGIFCAKEAAAKAIGTGFCGAISLLDFEISHDENGAPQLTFFGAAQMKLKEIGKNGAHVSISHEKTHAVAVCMLCD